MILVKLMCRRCNRALLQIDRRPSTWEGQVVMQKCACTRLDMGTQKGQSLIREKDPVMQDVLTAVSWSDLRRHVERAEATGRTQRVMFVVS